MFWGKKAVEADRFIIAVKDYNNTLKGLKEGTLSVPFKREVYVNLIETQSIKVDNLKELNKFIKSNKKIKGEVFHFWEGLITQGYTLLNVSYAERAPSLDTLCSKDEIKYVCKV